VLRLDVASEEVPYSGSSGLTKEELECGVDAVPVCERDREAILVEAESWR
jgi:hypothetical protein